MSFLILDFALRDYLFIYLFINTHPLSLLLHQRENIFNTKMLERYNVRVDLALWKIHYTVLLFFFLPWTRKQVIAV